MKLTFLPLKTDHHKNTIHLPTGEAFVLVRVGSAGDLPSITIYIRFSTTSPDITKGPPWQKVQYYLPDRLSIGGHPRHVDEHGTPP